MNSDVIRNALGGLARIQSAANHALRQVEAGIFRQFYSYEFDSWYEDPGAVLASSLQELHDVLLVVLEAAEMPESRLSLAKAWGKFTALKDSLQHTSVDSQFMSCESPALTFLERMTHALELSVNKEISSTEEAWTLNRLEDMLKATSALVHGRGVRPSNEHALQAIMHDYLKACFADFRLNPPIGGTLKTFKPDCGIAGVAAAVEFKLVHSAEQVAIAFSGIAEDCAGYKGSKDWTRFYAVLYQAEPFATESQVRNELKRLGAKNWTAIVVNGPTKRTKASRTEPSPKREGPRARTNRRASARVKKPSE